MDKERVKIDDKAFAILQTYSNARQNIKDFHKEVFYQVYGYRADEFFDLIFSKEYNFFSWDRARIKIQKLYPSLSPEWDREEKKEQYKNYAKTPLQILEFGGLYEEVN